MCGDCNTFKYLCPAANEEFAILLNNILEIDGESCSHWAGKFITFAFKKNVRAGE